jgi:hypothetical protein
MPKPLCICYNLMAFVLEKNSRVKSPAMHLIAESFLNYISSDYGNLSMNLPLCP